MYRGQAATLPAPPRTPARASNAAGHSRSKMARRGLDLRARKMLHDSVPCIGLPSKVLEVIVVMQGFSDHLRYLEVKFSEELVRLVEGEVSASYRKSGAMELVASKGRSDSIPATILRAIPLNGETCTAEFPDGPVRLTRVEFKLLRYLIVNADRVVSYKELMEAVVKREYAPDSALLRVHLLKLRRKLGPWSGIVTTVRGQGLAIDGSLIVGSGRVLRIHDSLVTGGDRKREKSSYGNEARFAVDTTTSFGRRGGRTRVVLTRPAPRSRPALAF